MRLEIGGAAICVAAFSLIRAVSSKWSSVPLWVDFYLMLLLIAVIPIGSLCWLIRTSAGGADFGAIRGLIFRLFRVLLALIVAVYGLGIFLMVSG